MSAIEIKPDIYWIGVNDRTTDLFEGLWPISKEGVSYNSYVIKDNKSVLIDLAKALKTDEFFDHVDELINICDLDYVVINHLEPDHTGVLKTLLRIAPDVTILCSEKCRTMLADFYNLNHNIQAVSDGETLTLGKRTIQFFSTPFVHWPETMMTYETSDHILFSCDAFGSYGALRGAICDDQCTDPSFFEKEALRYYVNIVAKFSNPVLKAIEKLGALNVDIIAPSHGLIWRNKPERIIDLYAQWARLSKDSALPGVTLLYGSMYGNTEKVMNAVAQGISGTGLEVDIFDVARTHASYILPSLWTKSGVVIGAPTYEGRLFPPMVQMLEMAALKNIRNRSAAYFGSYGWSGGALKGVKEIIEPLKWRLLDSFEFTGGPVKADIVRAEQFGASFAKMLTA